MLPLLYEPCSPSGSTAITKFLWRTSRGRSHGPGVAASARSRMSFAASRSSWDGSGMVTPLRVLPDGYAGTERMTAGGQHQYPDTRRDLGSLRLPRRVHGLTVAAFVVLQGLFPAGRAEHEDSWLRHLDSPGPAH